VCVVLACYTIMWIMSSIVLRFDYIVHTFFKYCNENNMILNYEMQSRQYTLIHMMTNN
jgi:hypothetical protein